MVDRSRSPPSAPPNNCSHLITDGLLRLLEQFDPSAAQMSGKMSGLSSAEDYGALAGELDVSDVTSHGSSATVLRRLKNDDPDFCHLQVGSHYAIEGARFMGVLGHFLGRSTHTQCISITLPEDVGSGVVESFLLGLQSNRSIGEFRLVNSHLPRDFFPMLKPFIRDNCNLGKFHVKGCHMDIEQYRALSSALGEGKSLRIFEFDGGRYQHEQSIIDTIEALKMHPQLQVLRLRNLATGRNVCAALSDLLRHSAVDVRMLHLHHNEIDDSGVEALADGLAHSKMLWHFELSGNPQITVNGWRALAALLEDPNSALRVLNLQGSGINDESAAIFANALANNSTLTTIFLDFCPDITSEGWAAFSKVLCDTSTVNSTFLSNHTLQHLASPAMDDLPGSHVLNRENILRLNCWEDKQAVAIKKILMHHDDFNMQPLFEWDLKVLPFVIEWFERAAASRLKFKTMRIRIECEARTEKRKLSAVYQFIRGMPELAIEGITGVNKKSVQTRGQSKSGKRRYRAPPIPTMLLLAMLAFLSPGTDVNAFATPSSSAQAPAVGALHLARKYVVIGGNIPGIDPNKEEDTYNMSKKERRRREREKGAADFKKGKYKTKKQKLTSNANVDYDKLEERVTRERAPLPREARDAVGQKKLSPKAARIERQRTAGGAVDSMREAASQPPGELAVQIRVAKRSNKVVTMVQGLAIPMSERKALLKEMKGALGGGGTLAAGVLELQGSHAERVLEMLKAKGYAGAKVVGGGK